MLGVTIGVDVGVGVDDYLLVLWIMNNPSILTYYSKKGKLGISVLCVGIAVV